ncbi:amidohydrolase [Allostella vacuolata]|nr:amidohydrolase [Stella vacuolata]
MIIDVHAHALSEAFVREMAASPGLGMPVEEIGPHQYRVAGYGILDPLIYDLPGRLESLRRRNVSLQLVGPPPPLVANGGRAAGVDLARRINQSTAWVAANGEGRIGGLAVPPLGEPEHAADELRRAVDAHGFLGVNLSTAAGARTLDDPAFEDLFATIEAMDLMVFMHSTSSALSATQSDFTLRTLVGWPTETTVAAARLVFAGVLERHPRLKIVLSHGGGTLASLMGRIDLGWSAPRYEANARCRENITRAPSTYLRQFHVDTVVADPDVLAFVVRTFGADHVLFGSDFPYEIGDAEGLLALPGIGRLPQPEQAAILRGNAARLLGPRLPAGI